VETTLRAAVEWLIDIAYGYFARAQNPIPATQTAPRIPVTTTLSNATGNTTTTFSKLGITIIIDRTQVHSWLLPPIPKYLCGGQDVCSDWWQADVVLESDLGWRVGQKRIDTYGNVG
jgi:hypothetical protein